MALSRSSAMSARVAGGGNGKKVLFYTKRNTQWINATTELALMLENAGYTVDTYINASVFPDLSSYDVLAIMGGLGTPWTTGNDGALSFTEKSAIENFVKTSGKSLFATGDYTNIDLPKYNDVTEIFDVTIDNYYTEIRLNGKADGSRPSIVFLNYYWYASVADVQSYCPPNAYWPIFLRASYNGYSWFRNPEHEIFNNVNKVIFLGSGFINPKSFGTAALVTHPIVSRPSDYATRIGYPVVTALESGSGRVVISADTNAFANDGFSNSVSAGTDNRVFALNIFNWLARVPAESDEVTVTANPSELMINLDGVGTGIVFEASSPASGSITFTIASGSVEYLLDTVTTVIEGDNNIAKLSWWGNLPDNQIASAGTYSITAEMNNISSSATFTVRLIESSILGVGNWMKNSKDPTAAIPVDVQPEPCPTVPWQQMSPLPTGYFSALSVSDPVNIVSGSYLHSNVDISLKARLSIVLARVYNSLDPHVGAFGRGWSSPFTSNLEIASSSVVFINSDGSRSRFTKSGDVYESVKPVEFELTHSLTTTFYTVAHPHGAEWVFDSEGKILNKTEACCGSGVSDSLLFNYDTQNRLSSVSGANSRSINFTYNSDNLIASATDSAGRSISYTYDLEKNLISFTDAGGRLTSYDYNADNLLIEIAQPGNKLTQISYVDNKVSGVIEPGNIVSTFAWATDTYELTFVDPASTTHVYGFSPTWRLTDYELKDGGSTVLSKTFMSSGLALTAMTDTMGNLSSYTYGLNGLMQSSTDKLGNTTSYEWHSDLRKLTRKTDALGRVWQYQWDTNGNLLSKTNPAGGISSYIYDSHNNRISETDALGRVTEYEYDASGKRVAKTDPLNRRSIYGYDLRDRLTSETDGEARQVSYGYDAAGRRVSLTDGAGRIWRWNYDTLGRVTSEVDPLGNTVTNTYDAVGNVTTKTNARNQITSYQYDNLNRIIGVSYPDSSQAMFAYDLLGRETMISSGSLLVDAQSVVAKTYDSVGNILSESFSAANKSWHYSYDLMDNRVQAISPENATYSYLYDDLNRLSMMTTGVSSSILVATYTYDGLNRLVGVESNNIRPNTVNTYDDVGQLTRVKHYKVISQGSQPTGFSFNSNEEVIAQQEYTYDLAGNRTTMTNEVGSITSYVYDDSNWLTQVVYPGIVTVTYTYNGAGDRLTEQTNTEAVVSYAYDAAGRMTTHGTESFTYDADSNMLSDSVASYSWNSENRLLQASKALASGGISYEAYTYIPEDWRRIIRKASDTATLSGASSQNISEFYSVYDLSDESHEYLKQVSGSLSLVREFIGGPATDDIEYTKSETSALAMLKDALGSTIALTGSGIMHIASIDYDAWGKILSTTSQESSAASSANSDPQGYLHRLETTRSFGSRTHDPLAFGSQYAEDLTPYLYTGRRYSDFTQQYFNRNRYYSPALGRFISKDPIGFNGGHNLYRYADNNPLIYIDPTGNFAISAIVTISIKNAIIAAGLFGGGVYLNTPEGKEKFAEAIQEVIQAAQTGKILTVAFVESVFNKACLTLSPEDARSIILEAKKHGPGKKAKAGAGDKVGAAAGSPEPDDDDPNDPEKTSLKKVGKNELKRRGHNAHKIKEEYLGRADGKLFDLHVDTKTGIIYILRKGARMIHAIKTTYSL